MNNLLLLKLGGSLITDKDQPHTARADVLARLAQEIAAARQADPSLRLIIGHGSGSFGHQPAKKFGTRQRVHSAADWRGFAEVWQKARALNQIVVEALTTAGVPVIAFPPSACITARDGQTAQWDLTPLVAALNAGLVPLVNGDTVFDELRGGTILSTEDVFVHLTHRLNPRRILLAGLEAGVWADFPACTRLVERITPRNAAQVIAGVGGSASVDVTGGMLDKVKQMLALIEDHPQLEVLIFSGSQPGLVLQALSGRAPGTLLTAAN